MSASSKFIHLSRWWFRMGRWLVLTVALAGFGLVYLWLAGLLLAQTNHTDADILGSDQKHNMKLALETRADLSPDLSKGFSQPIKDWFPHRTDGVVNPLWPWIAAWLAEPDHAISGSNEVTAQDRAFFQRGRWFHVAMTLAFLLLLGVACGRAYSLPAALNVVLLAGLGALLPRAMFFQPEPVFYIFFLLTWVACIFALKQNSLWAYGVIGVCSGIAYLAKGSVAPLVLVFVAVSTLRWAWGWLLAHWPGHTTTLWVRRNHFFGLFVLVMCHFMTAGPRLAHAADKFGNPFHSYPEYWMWFDDFESAFAWMGAHGSKESLQNIPPAEKPSFSNYLATHGREKMLDRLMTSTANRLGDFFNPGITARSREPKPWKGVLELRGAYAGALMLILSGLLVSMLLTAPKPAHAGERLHPEAASIVLFVTGAFAGYSLLYGWYLPEIKGERFMLSLYAPLVLSLTWGAESLLRRARRRKASLAIFVAYEIAQWLLFIAICWRLIEIARFPFFRN